MTEPITTDIEVVSPDTTEVRTVTTSTGVIAAGRDIDLIAACDLTGRHRGRRVAITDKGVILIGTIEGVSHNKTYSTEPDACGVTYVNVAAEGWTKAVSLTADTQIILDPEVIA